MPRIRQWSVTTAPYYHLVLWSTSFSGPLWQRGYIIRMTLKRRCIATQTHCSAEVVLNQSGFFYFRWIVIFHTTVAQI